MKVTVPPHHNPYLYPMKALAFLASALVTASSMQAAIIPFDLLGKAGAGLLSGNENTTITAIPNPLGFGGEVNVGPNGGIFFDDITSQLTLNFAWGAVNGFGNLSGVATAGHIHGPTTSGGSASFLQNASVRLGLDSGATWNTNATNGGVTNRVLTLDATQAAELLAGRWYVNIHTSQNGPGEIRGNLTVVPEPSTALLAGLGLAGLLGRRRRQG